MLQSLSLHLIVIFYKLSLVLLDGFLLDSQSAIDFFAHPANESIHVTACLSFDAFWTASVVIGFIELLPQLKAPLD